jgi:hypothetical protein
MDVSVHARCAWIMDFLMQKAKKSEEEAAHFVVEHSGLRTWLNSRSQQNSATDWRVVANWRDRIKSGSCTEEERIAFEATAEMVNLQLDTPRGAEREARKLLRAFKKSILIAD